MFSTFFPMGPPYLFHRVAPQTVFPQPVPSQGQEFTYVLVEFHEVHWFVPTFSLSWVAALPSSILTSLPRLMSYANLLRENCVISSRSLVMILNRTGPGMDLYCTLLVTGLQEEYNPLLLPFQYNFSDKFLYICLLIHPHCNILSTKTLFEAVESLSFQMASTPPFSSTNPVGLS